MTVGTRLKEERKRLRLTQPELSEACGLTKWAQINFEKDENLPGAAYLIAAEKLGVDVAYVLSGRRQALSADEAALLAAYRAAVPAARSGALAALVANVAPAQTAAPRVQFNDNQIGNVYNGDISVAAGAAMKTKVVRKKKV